MVHTVTVPRVCLPGLPELQSPGQPVLGAFLAGRPAVPRARTAQRRLLRLAADAAVAEAVRAVQCGEWAAQWWWESLLC